jgi:hypothetical protein
MPTCMTASAEVWGTRGHCPVGQHRSSATGRLSPRQKRPAQAAELTQGDTKFKEIANRQLGPAQAADVSQGQIVRGVQAERTRASGSPHPGTYRQT